MRSRVKCKNDIGLFGRLDRVQGAVERLGGGVWPCVWRGYTCTVGVWQSSAPAEPSAFIRISEFFVSHGLVLPAHRTRGGFALNASGDLLAA